MNAQQPMDYILGKMTEATTKQQSQTRSGLPPANAFSLFTAALDPIPEAFVAGNSDPDVALTQLRLRLRSLLALRLLRTILGDTSPLKVSAEILPVDEQNQPLAKTGRSLSSRGLQTALLKTQAIATTPLKLGNSIGVRVKIGTADFGQSRAIAECAAGVAIDRAIAGSHAGATGWLRCQRNRCNCGRSLGRYRQILPWP
jgi:hypothetical protein